ncbi:MAG: alpha/beta fold hydrolase [Pirellulales bacterium]|nr:alpha/beta fold hydrolase [Pirellulales bacterium]
MELAYRLARRAVAATAFAAGLLACFAGGYAQEGAGRVPPPQALSLTTKDGVQLRITYYASNAGVQAVPVVMLHDYNETRAVFDPLARALQNPSADEAGPSQVASRAVVTVDLRGHGDSKTGVSPGAGAIELDASRFESGDFQAMVQLDMEAVRAFLLEQNDAGMLNLNSLCLVGSGMGANVAVLFAANDWAMPPLAVRKQGQDVKALVLLSPRWRERGLFLRDAFAFPPVQRNISIMLAYGRQERSVADDCRNMVRILEKYHPPVPADQAQTSQSLFVYATDTNLQGTKLLTSRAFGMGQKIVNFIEARLGRNQYPYLQRKAN